MKVVFVVGTTASGKSAYAQSQAVHTGGAIINCDSVQLYQSLVIGSALPTEAEMKEVPHFLFSYVPKGSKMTAGQYARDFYETMEKIKNQFPIIYVVGGTGFYFQAIEKGLFHVQRPDSKLRSLIEDEMKSEVGAEKIYQEMITLDPQAAERIHRNDHYRIARAVELMRVEKKSLSQIWSEFEEKKSKFPWELKKIGILQTKEKLLERVKVRTRKMLNEGWIEEVTQILNDQSVPHIHAWEALQSVGYKEVVRFLQKDPEISNLATLEAKIVQNTMKLAKKQRTWFQRDQEIEWIQQ